ncbi:hypothetical protein D9611_008493 [Ephemerocybe angulata]|uniref:Yeast cell wall synthesis Kre9/Knh1-like N-terminal domain-containing protein n=1 Tax=Ephemerocybe angulata TaxID=980116 RepID=A0A8H5EUX9_9AGAR|nr:hypothetical protein D9611_008493 [Tulosesus angulatus]
MFSKTLIVLAVAAQVFAGPFITSPVATTTFSGGKEATITWIDNGQAPTLKDFGPAKVSIYVGNAQQQTTLQTISASVDVSTTGEVKFTVDPKIGPNSQEYFIRVESLSLKDATSPQYPALAFSAKFALDSMTGTFTPEIQAQIAGQSTAPLATQTPAKTGTAASTSTTASSSSTTKAAASTTTSAAAKPANGAISAKAGWAGILIGAIAGVALF